MTQAAFSHRGFTISEKVRIGKGRRRHEVIAIQELMDGSIRFLLRGPDARQRWVPFIRVNKA